MTPARVSLGVTINLGNYESLRVDIEGAAGEEMPAVVERLDAALACLEANAYNPTRHAPIHAMRLAICGYPPEALVAAKEAQTGTPVPNETPPPAPPEPKPAAQKPAGAACVGCGADVPAAQAKVSQMFLSKTLCKACMEEARPK